jgi:hypothetical protein
MQKTDIIISFCIFQYIDSSTGTYLSYLGDSVLERNIKTGIERFVCKEPDQLYRGWHNVGSFLAVNPIPSHPIQTGMKLYCVKQTTGFPYNSISAHIEYDPFNIDPDCIYFIAYNQRVPFTIPLYFHTLGDDNIFASFDKDPPSDDPNWSQANVSPVYVISPSTFSQHPRDIPFKCVNEKCIPFAHDIPDLYDDTPDKQTTTFDRCVLLCSGLGLVNEGAPSNLITSIGKQNSSIIPQFMQIKSKNLTIGFIVALVTVFIGLIWLLVTRAKKRRI